ncbi:exopolysaccharide biosynthesis polyprenyl glycosylphosphotransferase [Chromohalobacter israelensis]|uniref:Sugar transferase n=1 Tax=Chromohalobacter israelensis (strain ATCC BAA-138 / DSM 3043 / CIP 106854 / NCIMB 13768 / 1H11) TaxID=290398 RepID=Q1QWU5_CHRI1|nr:exopolysaccharide biosynthesis polyprenyl glycosylphosphotransferase [Chromohalobacter salexigens]ABE59063.1 sugar transferase [Chromohalobacter salexigens DSM 3043]
MFDKHKVFDQLDRSAWVGSESLLTSREAPEAFYERRHSRWYEQCLMGMPCQWLIGLPVVLAVPALVTHGVGFWRAMPPALETTLWAIAVAFAVSLFVLQRLTRFPGTQASVYVLPVVTVVYALVLAVLMNAYAYQVPVFLGGYAVSVLWFFAGYAWLRRFQRPLLAVVPVGEAKRLSQAEGVDLTLLSSPNLNGLRVDGVVADLHSFSPLPGEVLQPADELRQRDNASSVSAQNAQWARFLTKCTLHGIPVYQIKQLDESHTGRVHLDHLAETEFTALTPSPLYSLLKRGMDLAGALLLLPLLAPIMLATAWAIRRDSPGPALFVQWRMGHRGRPFRIYKFRSMYSDQRGKGFTSGDDDPRITPVGRVIRKYRLDELPQLLNVLKGDMSFIGPRPESMDLSMWYEKDVPFFSYRHVVKPGISGWAQVEQGYAAEVDGMTVKLQYDFYYIKHFSLWLDLLIVFRTLKTIGTGFGAR